MSIHATIHDRLILASASPRRRELLYTLPVRFEAVAADIDETIRPSETPEGYVLRMATEKAAAGLAMPGHADCLVIGADTAVVTGGRILGKPVDSVDAMDMLSWLSGRTHYVLSGVTVCDRQQSRSRMSKTAVTFRVISQTEQASYWATGEPHDKAGGYAIQGIGAGFVSQIVGSYSGVVGLPLYETAALLNLFGMDLLRTPL